MKRLIVALTVTLLSAQSHADLIDNGTYFSDTATGLDWLKLKSISDDGWTQATQSQVFKLVFEDALPGLLPENPDFESRSSTDLAGYNKMVSFIILVGGHTVVRDPVISSGFAAHYIRSGNGPQGTFALGASYKRYDDIHYFIAPAFYTGGADDNGVGTFMVRNTVVATPVPDPVATPVPEPETYALLLAGLGLIGVMKRRRDSTRA